MALCCSPLPPPPFSLALSVCPSRSPGGAGSCPVCRAVGQAACAHLVFRGLRASPVGCNFALLTGTQRDSAGDFLSDGPLLSTVLKCRKGRDGTVLRWSRASTLTSGRVLSHTPVPSGWWRRAVISASHPHHLPCDQQLAVCCRDLYPRFRYHWGLPKQTRSSW